MRVVLPAPLAPSSPTTSPARTSRSTPSTAASAPKRRTARVGRGVPPARLRGAAAAAGAVCSRPSGARRRGARPAASAAASASRARPSSSSSTVRGALGLVEVGRGDDHAGAAGGGAGDEPPELRPAHRVHAGRGLVEDQQLRLVQHGQREGQLLAHAAGEAAGEPARRCRSSPVRASSVAARASQLAPVHAVGAGHEGDVLVDAEVVVEPEAPAT